ncbi:MAG: multidrug efflux SMR transporter [Leptospirales bacterium]|nr:multidrug efflux SMR transporter [Leptospirales bacterium]
MIGWLFLGAAILSEIGGTVLLKQSAGMTRWTAAVAALGLYGLAFAFLAQSLNRLPLAMAYAIWSGIGTAGASVAGVLLFNETLSWPMLAGIALIVVGVLWLKLI